MKTNGNIARLVRIDFDETFCAAGEYKNIETFQFRFDKTLTSRDTIL